MHNPVGDFPQPHFLFELISSPSLVLKNEMILETQQVAATYPLQAVDQG